MTEPMYHYDPPIAAGHREWLDTAITEEMCTATAPDGLFHCTRATGHAPTDHAAHIDPSTMVARWPVGRVVLERDETGRLVAAIGVAPSGVAFALELEGDELDTEHQLAGLGFRPEIVVQAIKDAHTAQLSIEAYLDVEPPADAIETTTSETDDPEEST